MFRLCILAGLALTTYAETIPHVCACDFEVSMADLIMQSAHREVYCQRPVDESGAVNANGDPLYYCSDAIIFKGQLQCNDATRGGEFLCRNTQYCFAQGGWDVAGSMSTSTMACGDGYDGEQSRYCSPDGVWEAPDRSGCSLADGPRYCGRGSRNADCECESPQVRYSEESKAHGFKYEWGAFTSMPDWYSADGEGMVYYCGAPNRGRICGAGGDYSDGCVCGGGTVMTERDSRNKDNMMEYWCKSVDNRCGHTKKVCTGDYQERDIECPDYVGEGWVGNWCGDDNGDQFWRLSDAARNCNADDVCAAECGRRRLEERPRAQAALGWEDLDSHKDRRFLADGSQCSAINARFAAVCRDLGNRGGCNSYEGCNAKDSSNAANVSACARVSKGNCAAYTNPANPDPFCTEGSSPVCSWHHEGASEFHAYCRARDHWKRPEHPCRNRFDEGGCNDDDCEWVSQDDAMYVYDEIDRCGRYDNHENLCNTLSTCHFECMEDDGNNRDRKGHCEAQIQGEGPHCRGVSDAGECFNDAKCFWNYNGSCRCRSGDAKGGMGGVKVETGPSEDCEACKDNACQVGEDDYECVDGSWFDDEGYECTAATTGYECTAWGNVGEPGCRWCSSDNDSSSFFNEDFNAAPIGARAYKFCEANGRGLISARCLHTGKFGDESGTCSQVACPAIGGTNWSRTAAGTEAIAACQGGNETGYEARMCYSNGEWGPVEDLCETRDIRCGITKDMNGIWPETSANSRASIGCGSGYHGWLFRDCSADGHWSGKIGGKCVHECYDIIADDFEADGKTNILYTDRPRFEVVQDDAVYDYTCGNAYGKKSAKVISLKIAINKFQLCQQETVRDNCPETCKAQGVNVPQCDVCFDGHYDDDRKNFDFNNGAKLSCTDVRSAVAAEGDADSDHWLKDADVCGDANTRKACPLTCNSCGKEFQCRDSMAAFSFKGSAHYCHETTADHCYDKTWSDNCAFSCGGECESDYVDEETGGACPESDPDYIFSYDGFQQADDGGLGTTCKYIANGVIQSFPGYETANADICAHTAGDQDGWYADKPLPRDACAKECNALFPDTYSCEVAPPECKQPENTTWVVANYDGVWMPGQIDGAEADCHSAVKFTDGNTASYHNDDLDTFGMCSCGDNRTGGVDGTGIACEEKGFCSEVTDGLCHPGEDFCYF